MFIKRTGRIEKTLRVTVAVKESQNIIINFSRLSKIKLGNIENLLRFHKNWN